MYFQPSALLLSSGASGRFLMMMQALVWVMAEDIMLRKTLRKVSPLASRFAPYAGCHEQAFYLAVQAEKVKAAFLAMLRTQAPFSASVA